MPKIEFTLNYPENLLGSILFFALKYDYLSTGKYFNGKKMPHYNDKIAITIFVILEFISRWTYKILNEICYRIFKIDYVEDVLRDS